jgi:hypothetical protein
MDSITLEKLSELCYAYDDYYGPWPESKFEGHSIYNFIMDRLAEEKTRTES